MPSAAVRSGAGLPALVVRDGAAFVDSRDLARVFGKKHGHVLRDIEAAHCSLEFRRSNFASFKIKDLSHPEGESTSHVEMTRDGFAFVALGFTGTKAGQFKEAYIAEFNAMERALRELAKPPLPDFTNPAIAARA